MENDSRKGRMFLGIDLGSISSKYALIDDKGRILKTEYQRHKGQPLLTIFNMLKELFYLTSMDEVCDISVTGTSGKLLADLLGVEFINEIIAHSASVTNLYPSARTIIDIGGEDAKLIILGGNLNSGKTVVADFSMNSKCAAGTGSFLDQQASRLGISIEEFGELALKSKNPPRIAGRCSVFAKSDMIHLQQKGTPAHDILAGLCFALARNFKGTVGKGKSFEKPVVFQGGVAANKGMVRAFQSVLELFSEELIIPKYFALMGAIGSALVSSEKTGERKIFKGIWNLEEYIGSHKKTFTKGLPPLKGTQEIRTRKMTDEYGSSPLNDKKGGKIDAYLGVDIGSVSTNIVVMDKNKSVLSKRYLWTAGNPIRAVMQGLEEVGNEIGNKVNICGVCTTGSGRYMIGDFIGADLVKNEITAQAKAASEIDPNVDTVFEIGGQDSKYISLRNGVIVDFEMNKACAAGTGSFLEEQAERLSVNIKGEFGDTACSSTCPARLGENCTVFMESGLNYQQQQGVPREDLVAGLAYSIVYNYLNRVVGQKRVGENIFFQGGVAFNKAVVRAFEQVTGKQVTVPEHHEVTGAIGCCLLAMGKDSGARSRFKGFDLSKRDYQVTSFACQECSNLCEINRVKIEGEKSLFYGSRCEKYDVDRDARERYKHIPDLFKERMDMLLSCYPDKTQKEGAVKIGLPKLLFMLDFIPYWKAFFSELGFEVVFSDDTTKSLIFKGLEAVVAETCYPVKVAHAHVINLIEKGVKYIFNPCVMDFASEAEGIDTCYPCPYVQTQPYIVDSAIGTESMGVKMLKPVIRFKYGVNCIAKELHKELKQFRVSKGKIIRALKIAQQYQDKFSFNAKKRGEELLKKLKPGEKAVLIVGRSYNSCDPGVNLDLPRKLKNLGVLAIPMDFLSLPYDQLRLSWPNMTWRSGQRILSAGKLVRNQPNLHAIYITNFACGPDSFLYSFFKEEMSGKPFLLLEIDEHSADAGAITRVEAFFDSIEYSSEPPRRKPSGVVAKSIVKDEKRTIYIPQMGDHAFAMKASFIANGIPAEVIPMTDATAIQYGIDHTCGKECFPCTVTTGDMVKIVLDKNIDKNKIAFFMPSAPGSCRFDKYNVLQRLVLKNLGYENVRIYSPDQSEKLYEDLGIIGNKFIRQTWQGVVAIDYLDKLLRETRPYEVHKGETNDVYKECLDSVCNTITNNGNVFTAMEKSMSKYEKIRTKITPKPIIGIIGEIFIRNHKYSNDYLVEKIEELGGEAWLPTIGEWFLYINEHTIMRNVRDRKYRALFKTLIHNKVMKADERRVMEMFRGKIKSWEEPETKHLMRTASPYITPSYAGESTLSIGKAIDFISHGVSGIINITPFTCMPGTIVNAVFKKVKEKYPEMPFLSLAYDAGSDPGSQKVRLEAFMYQASQHKQVILRNDGTGSVRSLDLRVFRPC